MTEPQPIDAIPEAAVDAVRRELCRWVAAPSSFDAENVARRMLAAAAPHMAGSGEAERLHQIIDEKIDSVGDLVIENERLREAGDALADALRGLDSYAASSQAAPLERSKRAARAIAAWDAQPDTERAPQPEPRREEQNG